MINREIVKNLFINIAVAISVYFLSKVYVKDSGNKIQTLRNDDQENETLIREQLARNYAFLGEASMQRLRQSYVIIVGCGGVGSHAAHMLARSGIGRMRLIDFDNVTLSSLNRAPLATRSDVGTSKVSSLEKKLKEIAPWVVIESVVDIFSESNAQHLIPIDGSVDMVLDCIDNIDTKIDLLEYCYKSNIMVVSSMGSGCKSDPTKVAVCDISKTQDDPLSRAVRRRLKQVGIDEGIPVVYSCERFSETTVGLLSLSESCNELDIPVPSDYAILPGFRSRIVPVLGPMPAIFGQILAMYVIVKLSNDSSHSVMSSFKADISTYHRYIKELESRERKRRRQQHLKNHPNATQSELVELDKGTFPIKLVDAEYVVESIWHGKSVLPASTHKKPKLVLVRWRHSSPLRINNLVLMTVSQAIRHEEFSRPEDCPDYNQSWIDSIDAKLTTIK